MFKRLGLYFSLLTFSLVIFSGCAPEKKGDLTAPKTGKPTQPAETPESGKKDKKQKTAKQTTAKTEQKASTENKTSDAKKDRQWKKMYEEAAATNKHLMTLIKAGSADSLMKSDHRKFVEAIPPAKVFAESVDVQSLVGFFSIKIDVLKDFVKSEKPKKVAKPKDKDDPEYKAKLAAYQAYLEVKNKYNAVKRSWGWGLKALALMIPLGKLEEMIETQIVKKGSYRVTAYEILGLRAQGLRLALGAVVKASFAKDEREQITTISELADKIRIFVGYDILIYLPFAAEIRHDIDGGFNLFKKELERPEKSDMKRSYLSALKKIIENQLKCEGLNDEDRNYLEGFKAFFIKYQAPPPERLCAPAEEPETPEAA